MGIAMTILFVSLLPGGADSKQTLLVSKLITGTNLIIFGVYFFIITLFLQVAKNVAGWMQVHHLSQLFSHTETGVEEDRIFMFLDMKSSTTHAERLGIAKYSNMIRDCFDDMTAAALKTNAELYQYAGDEVIFSWETCRENFVQAVELFFQFRERLRYRSEYYKHKYGIAPTFKAGVHHGEVIRVLVNVNRMATAYHGDAINTAARIQGKCNELGCDLLVSDTAATQLQQSYSMQWEGKFILRGKRSELGLFSVQEPRAAKETLNGIACHHVIIRKTGVKNFSAWLNVL
jgi:adenylate cyclase